MMQLTPAQEKTLRAFANGGIVKSGMAGGIIPLIQHAHHTEKIHFNTFKALVARKLIEKNSLNHWVISSLGLEIVSKGSFTY